MSPHSASSSRTASEDADASCPAPDTNDGSPPSDEVDFVLETRQTANGDRVQNASAKLQGVMSQHNAVPASNDFPPRVRPDVRGGQDHFSFAPAPRYASGHFTNRKIVPIVPRTDGPEKHQQPIQPQPDRVAKDQASGPRPNGATRDTTDKRPAALPPVPLFPQASLSAPGIADTPPKGSMSTKTVRFPFAKNPLPRVSHDQRHNSTPRAHQPARDSIAARESSTSSTAELGPAKPSSKSPPGSPHRAPSERHHTGSSKVAHVQSHSVTESQGAHSKAVYPAPETETVRTNPQQVPDVPVEGPERERTIAEAAETNRPRPMGVSRKPMGSTVLSPPGYKSHSSSKQGPRAHQSVQPGVAKPYQQMDRHMRKTMLRRINTRSPSMSCASSGMSDKMKRSAAVALARVREQAMPQVVQVFNDMFRGFDQVKGNMELEKDRSWKKLQRKSKELAELLETTKILDEALQDSEIEKQSLRDHNKELERQLQVSSDKYSQLTDKFRSVKHAVSLALDGKRELLELHNRHKKKSEEAIQEIRAAKQQEQSLRELIDRQLSAVREHMKEKVQQVQEQSQEECRRLQEKMQLLQIQAEEKDAEARREREITDQLNKQLGESCKAHQLLDDMRAETSKMVKLLRERHEDDKLDLVLLAQEEAKAKLESMTDNMESVRDMLGPHCEAVSKRGSKQDEGIAKIISSLTRVSETQNGDKETIERLGTDMRCLMNEMWQHLETREDDLTHQLECQRGENATLQGLIEEGDQERQTLQEQLSEADELRRAHEDRIQDLLHRVKDLEAQPRVDPDTKARLETLAREKEELKAQLVTNRNTISDLKSRLEAGENDQVDILAKEISELRNLTSQHCVKSKLAQDKAVGEAVARVQEQHGADLAQAQEKMQNNVHEAEEARQSALLELEDTKKKLSALEVKQKGDDEQTEATAAMEENEKVLGNMHEMHKKLSLQRKAFESISKWASAKAEAHGLTLDLVKVWNDDGKEWPSILETLFAECEVRQELNADEPPVRSDIGSSVGAGPKRATVVSPHTRVVTPVPPSIEQERSRRRDKTQQPRPIMKRVTRSSPHADELLAGEAWELASLEPDPASHKNLKRTRETDESLSASANPFSMPAPREEDYERVEVDDDASQPKRAKTPKPKATPAPRRGRARSSQPKQQPPRSGLAAPGVVHGRLPRAVSGLPSEPVSMSQTQGH